MTTNPRSKSPRLLVVQPDPLDPLDRFAEWLAQAGVSVRVVQPYAGQPLPAQLEEAGLLVLGGEMSANDDDKYPWLADIRRLYRSARERSRPALGICLGSQLLAQTFGGTVTVGNRGMEAGVVRVDWLQSAQSDPLLATLPTPFLAGTMHGDMVTTLPPEAVWLGRSDMYPHQAFRVGPLAWGVQFHPEISPITYASWVDAYRGGDPVDRARLRHGLLEFSQLADDVSRCTSGIALRFAEIVQAVAEDHEASPALSGRSDGVHPG